MSHYRSSTNDERDRNHGHRRDRSRSEIRRPSPNNMETLPTVSIPVQVAERPEQSKSENSLFDFFKTLGLNSQLIQALINANPPKINEIPSTTPIVNNAQEFASFLSQNYGLDSQTVTPTSNPPINRDLRYRPISIVSSSDIPRNNFSITDQSETRYSTISSISIEESYKQFLASINQTLLDDQARRCFQRIALLDDELDRLHRMNIELTKNSERYSRRRISTKEKDPLLKENENLQQELIEYTKKLKASMINTYSSSMIIAKQ